MRIAIDAPAVRSLSANEKMVYQLLKEGRTPREIAKKLRLALGDVTDLKYNTHDVMPDTVVNLITSIREKGWDIPTDNNKEENEMARITEEQKREIVQLAMTKAMSHKEIAEKFGIGKSTVWWLVDQYRKSGETAFQKAWNEDFERSKSDDDSFCCEVTGDTDIEAYLAQGKKNEPATVGAVTSSEQENLPNIPADIVTPSEENVKTRHCFSPLVAEAIWHKVNELREEAIELTEHLTELEDVIAHTEAEIRTTDEQITFVDAEIDRLIEDYEALTGGAI